MDETLDLNGRDAWIDHAAALRALARGLISDEHDAEDAVQETWLAYLRQEPRAIREPRQWLAGVLRNLSVERLRRRTRRAAREEAAASEVHLPSGDEILERIELVKRVADHLTAVAEPYRRALHLRYFEGLSAPEIARHTGAKLETVRTRLRRGRALMRKRLDDDAHGDRQTWCLALTPIASLGAPQLAVTSLASKSAAPLFNVLVMTMRNVLILAISVTALAGALWMIGSRPADVQVADVATLETQTVPNAEDAPELLPPGVGDGRRDAAPALPEPQASTPSRDVAAAIVDVAVDDVQLDGSVVLSDEAGLTYLGEDGELFFHSTSARGEEWIKAVVVAGSFQCQVPSGARLRVGRLIARERLALCTQSWVVDEATSGVEVRATWTSDVILRVVSKATGEDLGGVTVKSRSLWRARIDELLPSESPHTATVAENALSPLALPDANRQVRYWARADGYAWGSLEVDHRVAGERVLELDPFSSLTVQVVGSLPLPAQGERDYIRLREQREGWHWNFMASRRVPESGPTVFEGLPAGRYLVCHERGDEEGVRRGAEQTIELLLGQDMTVDLSPDDLLLDPPKAQLRGRLYLPADVPPAKRMRMSLSPLDVNSGGRPVSLKVREMEAVTADPDYLAWDAGTVVPGEYIVYLSGIQHRVVIEATVGSDSPVEIHVPPLASLTIDVVDAADGTSLSGAKVTWSDGRLQGVSRNQSIDARRDAKAKRWVILAPAGEIELSISLKGHVSHDEAVELSAGENDLRVEMSRASGLNVSLVHEGVVVRADRAFWANAFAVSTDGRNTVQGWQGSRARHARQFLFDEAGEYELRFGELTGYGPIPQRRVDVLKGEMVDVVIEVVPE